MAARSSAALVDRSSAGVVIANDNLGEVVKLAEFQHVLEVEVLRAEFQGEHRHAPRMAATDSVPPRRR